MRLKSRFSWEKNAPTIDDRIEAAKTAKEAGYTVWVRIDPARAWTPIKLIALIYYVDMYSRIMTRQKPRLNISELIYIDPPSQAPEQTL